MRSFPEELKERRLLFDGSMGALLSSMGFTGDHPELLTVTNPTVIRKIHEQYMESGANVVITDSLGATPIRLMHSALSDRAAELAAASVKVAREAAGDRAWVALDIGPSGDFMQPAGRYTIHEMMESFSVCAQAGAQAGADFILLETMTDIAECRAACLAARKTGLPVAASFTFGENGRTLSGGTPECAALTLAAAGACAIGVNCSTGPLQMLAPLKAIRAVTSLPVVIQPNAGLPEIDEQGLAHYRFSPEDMLPHMACILEAGASAIGGCCGTTPEHIRLFSTLDFSAPPSPAWDGRRRICSARQCVLLEEALDQAVLLDSIDDLYELEDEPAALIDLRSCQSTEEAASLLLEAQTASNVPLIFRADDPEILDVALLNYAGAAAVYAPASCEEICRRYGAIRL